MRFWCKTISFNILNALANQHSCQLIFSPFYQNKLDLATFILEANRVQKFVDQCIYAFGQIFSLCNDYFDGNSYIGFHF